MMDVFLALVLPILLMVGVTRVTFHLLGATIVSFMVLFAWFRLHEKPWYVIAIALISLLAGWHFGKRVLKKKPGM
ncbi:DUF2198 family protein [Halalkalibacterium halodurans]|jgi:general stress protein CsbA|uniref:BH3597 protein n=2 Tax=Halalkalibacterium halodurans TaxID=86665 RepID=Q9K6X7_HALH5|nr:DUF2198 family protein [Halalkalibacterium halodurans]MDY7224074.1 DUF2198 family protein [Halalkalibacterium halodurans]MDY7243359.1 DUF2198 family protein [Halalkalibacterium halodurans]MED3647546.1 DUF2198 family protein [Halalkalibacterium halodurans]MED4081909.1 DUF2198 family protein [Halalkalibacterium halodurans]MED4083710.1 DUF2198 family protein [Halalkalibacterium halodurans]